MVVSHPRPNDLAAAATLIRFRQSRCRIQWVTWYVVFVFSGAQARAARKMFCKQRVLVHREADVVDRMHGAHATLEDGALDERELRCRRFPPMP